MSLPPRVSYPPDDLARDLREEAGLRALEAGQDETHELFATAADVIVDWQRALRRIAQGEDAAQAVALGALMAWASDPSETP